MNIQTDRAALSDIILQQNPQHWCMVSDADPQLLMRIVFKDPTTVTAVSIRATTPPDGTEGCSAPEEILFYANRDDLDFDDIDAIQPAQVAKFNLDQEGMP